MLAIIEFYLIGNHFYLLTNFSLNPSISLFKVNAALIIQKITTIAAIILTVNEAALSCGKKRQNKASNIATISSSIINCDLYC